MEHTPEVRPEAETAFQGQGPAVLVVRKLVCPELELVDDGPGTEDSAKTAGVGLPVLSPQALPAYQKAVGGDPARLALERAEYAKLAVELDFQVFCGVREIRAVPQRANPAMESAGLALRVLAMNLVLVEPPSLPATVRCASAGSESLEQHSVAEGPVSSVFQEREHNPAARRSQ